MKRIIAFLLALIILIGVLPCGVSIFAEETKTNLSLSSFGHSGNASGTGIIVATGVYPDASGTADKAPYIDSDTGSHKTNLGSTRIGVMAFDSDGVNADLIKTATLNVYVNFVNGNIGAGWLRFAAYETENPSLTYSVGRMNQAEFSAADNDYSYEAAMWSNEKFTNSGTEGVTSGWATIDVTDAVKNATLNGKGEVVLRFQVPTGGINLSVEGDYEPYIELITGDKYAVSVKCVDEDGNTLNTSTEYILEDEDYTAKADTNITVGNTVYTLDGDNEQNVTVTEDCEIIFNYTSTKRDILAKYEFEDISFAENATVKDSSGNEFDGYVAGGDLAIADGVYGNSINMNGSGYIELPEELLTEMKALEGFSVNALVKKNKLQHQFLFSASAKHLTSGAVSLGVIDAFNYRYEANGNAVTTGQRTTVDEDYVSLTATFDFANATGVLYIDGVQVGTRGISQTLENVNAAVLGIGVSPYNDGYYNGYIDQFEIYNSVLSSGEVARIAGLVTITPVYSDDENNRSYRGESIKARIGETITFEKSVKDNITFYNFDAINEGDLTTSVVYAEGLSYDYVINSTSDKNAAYKIADNVEIGGECSEYEIILCDTVPDVTGSSVTWSYDSDYVTFDGEKVSFEKLDYTYTVIFTATIEYEGENCTKNFAVLVHANDLTPTEGTRALDINGLGYEAADGENLIDESLFDYTCNSYTGWSSGGKALTDNFSIAEGYNDCSAIKAASLASSTAAGSINPYIPLPEHTGEETFIISFAAYADTSYSVVWSNAFLCDEEKNNTGFVWGTYDGTNYCYGVKASPCWTINRFAFTPAAEDKYIRLCIGWASNIAIDNISIVKADKLMLEVRERYVDNLTVYDDEQTVLGEGEYTQTLQYGEKYISEQVPETIEVDGVNYILVSNNSERDVKSDTEELTIDYRYIDEKDEFLHPGVLNTDTDLARIAQAIANEEEPYYSAYQAFTENSYANLGAARAVSVIYRGGTLDNCALLYQDAARAYFCAIRWRLTGDTVYADCARDILNAWSGTLKGAGGSSDRYLLGIYFYQITAASELMRDYEGFELERMQDMLYLVCYKSISERFLYSSEYGKDHNDAHIMNYWANWDLCNMAFAISLGVLCDRRDIYNRATEYYKNGAGNGSIFNAVPKIYEASESELGVTVGQWQEAGRDMPHAIMGVGQMAVTCEVAWNQGDDLYGWANNRFMYGAEYLAQAQMGYEMPFTNYYWYSGNVGTWSSHTAIATGDALRPVFEIVYNHYAKRKGYELPGVKEVVDYQSPEGGPGGHGSTFDQFGFGTLLYTREEGSDASVKLPEGNVKDGLYRIVNRNSGSSMQADDDGYVRQFEVDESNKAQLWKIEDIGGGVYSVINMATGKAMSIENNSYDLGALLTTSDYEGKFSQQFAFLCFEDEYDTYYEGYYRIVPFSSGLSLDVKLADSADGTDILQYVYNSGYHQQWELIPAEMPSGKDIEVNIFGAKGEKVWIFNAVYNKNGMVERVERHEVFSETENAVYTLAVECDTYNGEYVKTYVWKNTFEPVDCEIK